MKPIMHDDGPGDDQIANDEIIERLERIASGPIAPPAVFASVFSIREAIWAIKTLRAALANERRLRQAQFREPEA